jgi:hypothetical protein
MSEQFPIDCDQIDADLAERGYHILRIPELLGVFQQARSYYQNVLGTLEIHAPRHKFRPEDLIKSPWRKLAIGSSNALGENYAQLLQTTYFHVDRDDTGALHRLFKMLLHIRNTLMGVDKDFGAEPKRDKFWNACRVHHYPSGGGFMNAHRDTYFPLKLGDKPFYQVMALLSTKGQDFHSGGGYVVSQKTGEKVDLETAGGFGAFAIFDGRTVHGVDDVDLDRVLDFNSVLGRVAAFVNVYVYEE